MDLSRRSGSSSRPPRLRRLSSISSFSSDAPILANKDEIRRRRHSWILPGRVEDTSHFIAESRWGILLERAIMPVACESIEGWALYMLVFALVLTVPFGVHRWLYGWWQHRFFPIELANFLLDAVGLPKLPGGEMISTYATEEQSPGTDLAFAMHLAAGLLWLLCGFLLFFTVNKISKRSHRRLAYTSVVFLVSHLAVAAYNLVYVDAVKHSTWTKMILGEEILVAFALLAGGISAARRKEFQRHQDIMARLFILSVEGAGTIRLVSWGIWAMGRFFTPEAAAYFDVWECYNQSASSPLGINVRECQGSYLLRFHLLRLVSLYHNAMYLRLPEKVRDAAGRARLREEIRSMGTQALGVAMIIAAAYQLDHNLSYLKYYVDMIPSYVQLGVAISLAVTDSYERYKHSYKLLVMRRRGAVIPGRSSLLFAARMASQEVLNEMDALDDLISDSDSEVSDEKQKKE